MIKRDIETKLSALSVDQLEIIREFVEKISEHSEHETRYVIHDDDVYWEVNPFLAEALGDTLPRVRAGLAFLADYEMYRAHCPEQHDLPHVLSQWGHNMVVQALQGALTVEMVRDRMDRDLG